MELNEPDWDTYAPYIHTLPLLHSLLKASFGYEAYFCHITTFGQHYTS